MPLIASEGQVDYEPIEAGVKHAICCWVVDLGNQYNEKWDNFQHKVLIAWELPGERIEIEENGEMVDKPKVISRIFTLSLSQKSHLRPFLESWRGKSFDFEELMGFDISNLIGVNCQLNIVHAHYENKTYANVAAAMPLLKGAEKLKLENEPVLFSIQDHGLNFPEILPDWIKNKFMKSKEYNETGQRNDQFPQTQMEEPPLPEDDDIPF